MPVPIDAIAIAWLNAEAHPEMKLAVRRTDRNYEYIDPTGPGPSSIEIDISISGNDGLSSTCRRLRARKHLGGLGGRPISSRGTSTAMASTTSRPPGAHASSLHRKAKLPLAIGGAPDHFVCASSVAAHRLQRTVLIQSFPHRRPGSPSMLSAFFSCW